MFTKRMTLILTMTGVSLLIIAGYSTANAVKTEVTGTSYQLFFISPPSLEFLPSGNIIVHQEALWYDDATDNRVNGYHTATTMIILHPDGDFNAHGTLVSQEKLDDIPVENLISGNYDSEDIIQGNVLWEGTWTLTGDGFISGVAHGFDGLKFIFKHLPAGPNPSITFTGYILDPHGE